MVQWVEYMGLVGTDSKTRFPSFSTGPVLVGFLRGDIKLQWLWPSLCCSQLLLMTTEGY